MKTSNKLLTGMYLLVIVIILASFVISANKAKDYGNNLKRETLIFEERIDSLILNINFYSNVKITVGDSLLIKYVKSGGFKSDRIGNSLYIEHNASLEVEIPDSISYISVFAKECKLFEFNQDSLSIEGLNLWDCILVDSKINALNINSKSSKFILNNTNVESLGLNLKDHSTLQKTGNSNIKIITGFVDSTSIVNVTGINKLNQENKTRINITK